MYVVKVRGRRTRKTLSALASLLLVLALAVAAVPEGRALACDSGHRKAKNIILMIGDGIGYNHVEAADFYQAGRKGVQAYERFPVRMAMSTYEYELVDGITLCSVTIPSRPGAISIT